MWAFLVRILFVFGEQVLQVSLAEDAKVIETFGLDAEDKAFGVSVLIRLSRRGRLDADPLFFQNGIELGNEFAVTVADQMRRLNRQRGEVLGNSLGLFDHPGPVRVGREATDVNTASAEVDEEQDVVGLQSCQCPDLLGEEVAGKQGIGMALGKRKKKRGQKL